MIEQRKFIRLKAPIGVIYKHLKKGKRTRSNPTLLKDLSGGGVRIVVKEEMRVGDLLDIRIEIPHLHEAIHAIVEVAWYSPAKDKMHAGGEAGMRLRDIKPNDLHRILEYVHTIGIG